MMDNVAIMPKTSITSRSCAYGAIEYSLGNKLDYNFDQAYYIAMAKQI